MTSIPPKNSLLHRYDKPIISLSLIVRVLLGCLFIYMGINKISHPIEFLKQVHLYEMLPVDPPQAMNLTAIVLPWLEVVCGLSLLLGLWTRAAAVQIAIMLAVFTPAILMRALAIRETEGTAFFDIAFDCGCGAGVVVTWKKLLENSTLFILAVSIVLSRKQGFSLSALFDGRFKPSTEQNFNSYAKSSEMVDLDLAASPTENMSDSPPVGPSESS